MRELPSLQSLRFPLPVAGWPLLVLLALFLLAGVVGHDPWKAEDAANFGVVWRAVVSGDWLTFRFVTERVIEPPLYYWVAKLLVLGLSGPLAAADAARLATPLFAAATCLFLYLGARELYGPEAAAGAPLALVGSLGFLVVSHDTQPMIAAIAGLSAAYAGLALAPRQRTGGTILVGTGWAILVLAHGLALLPAALGTAVAACVFAPNRSRVLVAVTAGLCLALALIAPWAFLTASTTPDALYDWLAGELAQLAAAAPRLGNAAAQAKLLVWFAWPALPLAAWAIWSERRQLGSFAYTLPLTAFILILANLLLVFELRHLPALATLPPLSLLAAIGAMCLRRGAANAFDWFGRMTFTLAAGLIWLGWVAMNFGVPPRIARNFDKLSPGFHFPFSWTAFLVAAAATVVWLWICLATSRAPLRGLARWTSGIALLWLLAMLLWLPWIDYGKSYRGVAEEIARRVGKPGECIRVSALGEAQYASLDYFLVQGLDRNRQRRHPCSYLVTQGGSTEKPPGGDWQKLWEGTRPGDKYERFRLYVRKATAESP